MIDGREGGGGRGVPLCGTRRSPACPQLSPFLMPKGRKGKKTKGKRDAPGPEDDDGPEEAEGPEDSPESAGKPEQEGAKEMSPEAPEQKGGCCAKSSCCGEGSASMPTGMPKQLIAEFVPLDKCGQRHDLKDLPGKYVVYEQYKSETQLPRIMEMMTADLSEPYSIFTYRYFIHQVRHPPGTWGAPGLLHPRPPPPFCASTVHGPV